MSTYQKGRGFDLRAAYIPITKKMRSDIVTMIQLTDMSTVRVLLGYVNSGNQHVNLILTGEKQKLREHFWDKFEVAFIKKQNEIKSNKEKIES